MAQYSYRCPLCGNEDTRTIPIGEYNSASANQRCTCGALMTRVFDPPLLMETGKWRDQVASIGPARFMRREDRTQADRQSKRNG